MDFAYYLKTLQNPHSASNTIQYEIASQLLENLFLKWISADSNQELLDGILKDVKNGRSEKIECAPSPYFISKPLLQSPMAASMVLKPHISLTPPKKLSETMDVAAFIEDRKVKQDFTKSAFFAKSKEDLDSVVDSLQIKPESHPQKLPLSEEFEFESSIVIKKNPTKKFYPDLAEKQKKLLDRELAILKHDDISVP